MASQNLNSAVFHRKRAVSRPGHVFLLIMRQVMVRRVVSPLIIMVFTSGTEMESPVSHPSCILPLGGAEFNPVL